MGTAARRAEFFLFASFLIDGVMCHIYTNYTENINVGQSKEKKKLAVNISIFLTQI